MKKIKLSDTNSKMSEVVNTGNASNVATFVEKILHSAIEVYGDSPYMLTPIEKTDNVVTVEMAGKAFNIIIEELM